jgi:hypothetical protein
MGHAPVGHPPTDPRCRQVFSCPDNAGHDGHASGDTFLNLTVSPDELADLPRSTARLVFAAQDMDECSAAALFLLERDDLSGNVRRALETAVAVAYARPWGKSNTIGSLGDHWLPSTPQERFLHDDVIAIRHKVYAHTDEEIAARGIKDMSELAGVPGPLFVPVWHPLNPNLLRPIAQLAQSQKGRFVAAVQELQERVRSTT